MIDEKVNIQSTDVEYSGLCLTCRYAPNCVNRIKSPVPILFCEEFDIFSNPDLHQNPISLTKSNDPVANESARAYTGLCVNCDHRESCKLHAPEGGVWHCEEYE